jgi:hypothetical protein
MNLFKKIVLVIGLSLVSCDSNEINELKYSVYLEQICDENRELFCITESEYNRIISVIESNAHYREPCVYIRIYDIKGNRHEGYYGFISASSDSEICH